MPFAVLGAATRGQLYPGVPIAALAFVCPVTAGVILAWREGGAPGARALLARAGDGGRIRPAWYPVILLTMPLVTAAAYLALRATGAAPRAPHFTVPGSLVLFAVFVIAALGEELGWSGYALPRMLRRWSPPTAALVLGAVWALWHVIAMVQAGQSAGWIAWGCLDMVATRVIMVWLYDGTGGSVAAVALYHAVANLSIKTMFPGGSYPGERIVALLLTAVAGAVAFRYWTMVKISRCPPSASSGANF